MKNNFLRIIVFGFLVLGFYGCGSSQDTSNGSPDVGPQSQGGKAPAQGAAPHAESARALEDSNPLFIQYRNIWDGFSENTKRRVRENYAHAETLTGPGPGGQGYFDTLFGRVSPKFAQPRSPNPLEEVRRSREEPNRDGPLFFSRPPLFSHSVMNRGTCTDAPLNFLCLSDPAGNYTTVSPIITVRGSVDLNQVATSGTLIAMLSIINEATNHTDIMYSLTVDPMHSDFYAITSDIAFFEKQIVLPEAGNYTILLTALDHAGTSPVPSMGVHVHLQGVPQLGDFCLTPPLPPDPGNLAISDPQHRHDEVHSLDHVRMRSVNLYINLATAGIENVGVRIENRGTNGQSFVRYRASGTAREHDSGPVLDGVNLCNYRIQGAVASAENLTLYPGSNHFTVTVHNTQLDLLGLSPAQPSTVEFELIYDFVNGLPAVKFMLLSPPDGSIVQAQEPADPQNRQTVPISFCLTDNPHPTSPSHCLNQWNGNIPQVFFNNNGSDDDLAIPVTQIHQVGHTGTFNIDPVKPLLGGNLIYATVTHPDINTTDVNENILGTLVGSFGFGKINPLFANGRLNNPPFVGTDNFLKRGVSLDLHGSFLDGDLKQMIQNYLNSNDFKQNKFFSSFGRSTVGGTNTCNEVGGYSLDTADSTVNFFAGTTTIGNFTVQQVQPDNSGRLHLTLTLDGVNGQDALRGRADLRGLNSRVQLVEDGVDLGFIPIFISIRQLTIHLDAYFGKENGINKLFIVQPANRSVVDITGVDAFGRYIFIEDNRNPLARALVNLYGPGDVLGDSFKRQLKRTLLCGVENNLNQSMTGWAIDIQNLMGNNTNPFRIPFEFPFLSKVFGIEIAYDLSRGNIYINAQGLQFKNIPLRIIPTRNGDGQQSMSRLVGILTGGITEAQLSENEIQLKRSVAQNMNLLGSLSTPLQANEVNQLLQPTIALLTNTSHQLSVQLSEDAINQALFAANLAGLLDLDIDPNFYTQNQINPIRYLLPTVQDMVGGQTLVDVNRNGIQDDELEPVMLRLRTDKFIPPTLHFLTEAEVTDLATTVDHDTMPPNTNTLNSRLKYFRLSLSNIEVSLYRVNSLEKKRFCIYTGAEIAQPDAASLPNTSPILVANSNSIVPAAPDYGRVCKQTASPVFERPSAGCPDVNPDPRVHDYEEKEITVRNAQPTAADLLVRYKGSLILTGVIENVDRGVLFNNKNYDFNFSTSPPSPLLRSDAKTENFLRLRFLPGNTIKGAAAWKFKIAEDANGEPINHTSFSEATLTSQLTLVGSLLERAMGDNCKNLNSIQVPLPDRFPGVPAQSPTGLMDTLHDDFLVNHLEFGQNPNTLPQIFIENNNAPSFLDVLGHLGVCYTDNSGCSMP